MKVPLRCTSSAYGVTDTSACSAETYPAACPGDYKYFCKHDSGASSYYVNCDACVSSPICCDADEAATSSASNGGGLRCTASAYGVADTGYCSAETFPAACPACAQPRPRIARR